MPTLKLHCFAQNGFCYIFSSIFDHHISLNMNQVSVVIVASSYRLDSVGFESLLGQEIFSFINQPDWLWGQYSVLFSEQQYSFIGVQWQGHKDDDLPVLVANLRLNRAIPFHPLCLYCVYIYNFTDSLNISALRPAVNELRCPVLYQMLAQGINSF